MRIDVHAHLWSQTYLDVLERFGNTTTGTHRGLGAGPTEPELDARFALMASAGIDLQVLSSAPSIRLPPLAAVWAHGSVAVLITRAASTRFPPSRRAGPRGLSKVNPDFTSVPLGSGRATLCPVGARWGVGRLDPSATL